jgi:hypothetical protein
MPKRDFQAIRETHKRPLALADINLTAECSVFGWLASGLF